MSLAAAPPYCLRHRLRLGFRRRRIETVEAFALDFERGQCDGEAERLPVVPTVCLVAAPIALVVSAVAAGLVVTADKAVENAGHEGIACSHGASFGSPPPFSNGREKRLTCQLIYYVVMCSGLWALAGRLCSSG